MLIEEEIWKDVVGYEGLYQVSNMGRVKNINYKRTGEERLMKPAKSDKGYLSVNLCGNEKRKKWFVHRLVALAFPEICGECFEGCQCNHINEDKTDNRASNLNWMTPKENSNWGSRNRRVGESNKGKKQTEEAKKKISEAMSGENHPRHKAVQQFTLDGEFVATYPSIKEAERVTGVFQTSICSCCQGKRQSVKGFIWRYA